METLTSAPVVAREITAEAVKNFKELVNLIASLERDARQNRVSFVGGQTISSKKQSRRNLMPVVRPYRSLKKREQDLLIKVIHQETVTGKKARDLLITHCYGLVVHITKKLCYSRHPDFVDLIQWGMVGLIDAINRFEPTQGHAFSAFVGSRVWGEILTARRGTHLMHLSRGSHALAGKLKRIMAERDQSSLGAVRMGSSEVAELARDSGVSSFEVWDMLRYVKEGRFKELSIYDYSLDQPFNPVLVDTSLVVNQLLMIELYERHEELIEKIRTFRSEFDQLDLSHNSRRTFEVVYGFDGGPGCGEINESIRERLGEPGGERSYQRLYYRIRAVWKQFRNRLPFGPNELKEVCREVKDLREVRKVWHGGP